MDRFRGWIGVLIVIIVFIYIGNGLFKDIKDNATSNPITHDGTIRDGHKVDFEKEKEMNEAEIQRATQETKDDDLNRIIYTFNYCISTAKVIENYSCLSNLSSEDVKTFLMQEGLYDDVGKNLHYYLVQDETLTGIEVAGMEIEGSKFHYRLHVKTLEKKMPRKYKLTFENNKLILLEREEQL